MLKKVRSFLIAFAIFAGGFGFLSGCLAWLARDTVDFRYYFNTSILSVLVVIGIGLAITIDEVNDWYKGE